VDDQITQARDPGARAERHLRLARQYFSLAERASSPFLRADYQRAAEGYQLRAKAELRLVERERASTIA
jgi:hypothetical protein